MTAATSRRAALRGTAIAGLAGLIGTTAKAAPANTDADLIRACDRFADLEQARIQAYGCPVDLEAEKLVLAKQDDLGEEQEHALDEIERHLPPRTMEGLRALARATAAAWEKDHQGDAVFESSDQWLALSLIEALTEPGGVS